MAQHLLDVSLLSPLCAKQLFMLMHFKTEHLNNVILVRQMYQELPLMGNFYIMSAFKFQNAPCHVWGEKININVLEAKSAARKTVKDTQQ